MQKRIEGLIKRYRELYCQYKARIPIRPDIRNPQDQVEAERYLRWCDDNEIDEILFMEHRFRSLDRTRRAAPMFRSLKSDLMVESWKKGGESQAQQEQVSKKIMAGMDDSFTRAILDLDSLTPAQEHYKRIQWQRGGQEVCLVSPELSGGYHPLSRYCPYCPCSMDCITQLNAKWKFDVVALRMRRLEDVPERVAKAIQ